MCLSVYRVCFVLFFQALLCYFPKWLWESWEHQLMSTIVCGLNIGLRSEEEKSQKKSILIDYLIRHLNVSQFKEQSSFCCGVDSNGFNLF
jgi:hypothetical protein